jgi:uncharacterized protein (DUF1697 family)
MQATHAPLTHQACVVFLKGVNVGGHKTFRPSVLAQRLKRFQVINVGAAGTLVLLKPASEPNLRIELQRNLPFQTEIMICSAEEIIDLVSRAPFGAEPCGAEMVRFVSILAKCPLVLRAFPIHVPPGNEWLVKIIGIQGRFALGLYRRALRTISCLSQIEKYLGGSATTRNWNTVMKVVEILNDDRVENIQPP